MPPTACMGGHFHVYESLFLRSKQTDIKVGHASYFGIRHNTSIGSQAFFLAVRPSVGAGAWKPEDTWGGQISLQGNIVLDPHDATPIRLASSCSLLMLDNVIRGHAGVTAPVAVIDAPGTPSIVAVGNTVTVPKPYATSGAITDVDTTVVAPRALHPRLPLLPAMAPHVMRKIFEVPAKADGAKIQEIIDAAVKSSSPHPVVHLPFGNYSLATTLLIPANTDVQLIGDGQLTTLYYGGKADAPALRVLGPTHATLTDFQVQTQPNVTAIRIEGVDQPDGHVYGDQLFATLAVRDLANTRVELHSAEPNKVTVEHSTVALFGAATCGGPIYDLRRGGVLLVHDTWCEGGAEQWLIANDSGRFTIDGGKVACLPPVATEKPTILADNFHGKLTLIGVDFTGTNWLAVNGNTPETKVLLLTSMVSGAKRRYEVNDPAAKVGVLGNRYADWVNPRGGTGVEADYGTLDAAFLREMLADDRSIRPTLPSPKTGITCLRLHRIQAGAVEIVK